MVYERNKIVSNLNIADIAKRGLKDGDIIFDGAKGWGAASCQGRAV